MRFKGLTPFNEICFSCFTYTVTIRFNEFKRNKLHVSSAVIDAFLDAVEHDLFKLKPAPVRDNLTTRERQACKMLSRRNDIIIKSADKGSGTVVMDRDWPWYINECL